MDTKNIERKDGKVSFQVVIDAETFEAAVNKAYLRSKKSITVPGFRRGKAPRMVIEGMYGKDVFYEDAVDSMALEAYQTALAETGDRTVGDPAITDYHVAEDKTLTIAFEAALYPEVTLGEYKGLEAYCESKEVTEDALADEVEKIRKRNARIITVDRPAQDGDTLIIDFDGYQGGVAFEGGKAENQSLTLGSGMFVPGFEEQLVGAQAGDEREVNVTFPEDYAPELAGKDAVFKVTVHEVQETQLPELDDEFAKDVSEFDTLEEYKASIRQELETKKKEEAEGKFRSALLQKAVENMMADIPTVMFDRRVNDVIEDYARNCAKQGYSLEQYFQMLGISEQAFRGYIRPKAESDVRTELLLEAVAEAEQFEIKPEDVQKEYETAAERYDMDVEKLKEGVPENVITRDLKLQRAAELIYESGIATDTPPESDEQTDEAGAAEEAATETTEQAQAAE
ncbi:MAG: trigger factor [Oscillospiraceae bacterium]|nr:trigger factor [Oscillospiraceae bacterium]